MAGKCSSLLVFFFWLENLMSAVSVDRELISQEVASRSLYSRTDGQMDFATASRTVKLAAAFSGALHGKLATIFPESRGSRSILKTLFALKQFLLQVRRKLQSKSPLNSIDSYSPAISNGFCF